MMFFFNSARSAIYPVSRIHSAHRKSHLRPDMGSVILDDGERITVYPSTIDDITAGGTIIPALPGFFTVQRYEDDGEPGVHQAHIIAWSIDPENGVVPITVDGPNDGGTDGICVLDPCGRVTSPGDRGWDSLADYLAETPK